MLTIGFGKLSKISILAATLSFAAPPQQPINPLVAYYEGSIIQLVPETTSGNRAAALGPWSFGERLREPKPLDKRLNLYVVVPGQQYRSPNRPEYDHSLVINSLTHEKGREWDIFWCFVLDARLGDGLHSEKDLLTAAQQSFQPADLFDIEDIPGHQMLAEKTGIQTLAELGHYRHKDGSLPRVLILPARLAIRATAEPLPSASAFQSIESGVDSSTKQ